MAKVFQRMDPPLLRSLNRRSAAKNWSNENLVELVKKVLKTDMDLDFLLRLNPKDLEFLLACIRARVDQTNGRV